MRRRFYNIIDSGYLLDKNGKKSPFEFKVMERHKSILSKLISKEIMEVDDYIEYENKRYKILSRRLLENYMFWYLLKEEQNGRF